MKLILLVLAACALTGSAQQKAFAGKPQPGAVLEHFTLKDGRAYDGVWDATKSQIHIVSKSNHVGNLPISKDGIAARKPLGDASEVPLYSDVAMAEKVLLLNQQNHRAAQNRLATATRNRDNLHATYKGKNLPTPTYNAVMAQYKAADDEIANAQEAAEVSQSGFTKALEAYQKAGGKTAYTLQ